MFAVSVCGEQGKFPTTPTGGGGGGGGGGGATDGTPPAVGIVLPAPPHDTVQDITDSLKFTVADTDNVKLKSVQLTLTGIGGYSFSFSDSATVGVAGYAKAYAIPLKRGAPGHHVVIAATAFDASNNLGSKTDTILIVDQKPPVLSMSAPAGATTIGAGGTLKVIASASDISGVRYLGARLFTLNNLNQRVVLVADSNVYAAAPGSKTDTITVPIPASVAPAAYSLQAFTRDSSPTPNDTVSSSAAVQVITVLAPFGSWVFPPQDTAVVAGDNFLASFDAKDSAGVQSLSFAAYSVHGDSLLGTFTTSPRFTAIGSAMTAPLPKDTTIRRIFSAVPDSSIDSVFLAATVTNIGGVSATIRRRIQVIKGPFVLVTKPANLASIPTGVPDSIGLNAYSPAGIQWLGFTARGVAAAGDSISFTAPYAQNQSTFRFLTTPATTPLGVDTIVPFAVNGLGVRFTGKSILVSFADTVKPGVTVLLPSKVLLLTVAVGDSVLARVHVTDNRGVTRLVLTGVAKRGVDSLGTTKAVTRYVPWNITLPQSADTTITRYLVAATPIDSTGEPVYVVASATDSSGNTRADTSQVRVVSGPKVSVVTPANNAVTSPNKQLTIQVHAQGGQGVKVLGYRVLGVFNDSNSTTASPVNGKLLDTLTYTNTVTIPGATVPGTFAITAFAVDSTGNPSATIPGVVVTVLPVGVADAIPPLVQFTVPLRVEAGDSINVTATDPSGITKVGFLARDSVGTILVGDSVVFGGGGTYISHKFRLNLDTITTFPRVVTVEAFAVDNASPTRNRGVSSFSGVAKASPADLDTLTLVAGSTIALPMGGQFGDAIVDPNNQTMYLSNTLLDQLEVFHLATNSFGAPIRVGAKPVGLALWPRDTLGNNADTVIVANSGGTNLSIVDVAAGRELGRHVLPNYIVQTVKTQPTAAGGIQILTTNYDLADRPQYLGAVCRHLTASACDSVVAVYSTAPTPAQPGPFTSRGYLAWENLSNTAGRSGHFLWELAQAGTDTIQIISVRDTLPGQPIRDTILGAGIGTLVNLSSLAFQDSTFVRNSGDFNHSVIGEGGFNQGFARAMSFDGRQSVVRSINPPCPLKSPTGVILGFLNCDITYDNGTSEGTFVNDFLINRASRVLSVGTNFNGRTNVVRADSIYVFNYALKQVGLLQTVGGNPGMDVDPANKFDPMQPAGGPPGYNNDRLVLAARSDAAIDVFDTYWYQRVATIPIRDTIVGPVRVAKVSGVLVLAGVTSKGIVVVRLPNFSNPFLGAPQRPLTPTRPQVVPTPRVPAVPAARKPVPVP